MRWNAKLIGPAANVDWGTFRKEGDAYLRRLGVSDDVACYLVARLYILGLTAFRKGQRWNFKRHRWEKPTLTVRLDTPTVFDTAGKPILDRAGRFLHASMAPNVCAGCGGHCAPTATLCIVCWDKVRPRKKGAKRRHRPQARYLAELP